MTASRNKQLSFILISLLLTKTILFGSRTLHSVQKLAYLT